MLKPRDYQLEATYSIFRYFDKHKSQAGNPVVVLPTGCHAKDSEILMFDGSIKLVQDVQVGDQLMGPDSKPRNVLALARGRQEMRRITPTKGESFVVNRDHKLSMKVCATGRGVESKIETVTVNQYELGSNWFQHIRKLRRVGVEFPQAAQPVPAYIFGLMLGDGFLNAATLSYTGSEEEIWAEWEAYAQEENFCVAKQSKNDGSSWHTYISDPAEKGNRFTQAFNSLGLWGSNSYTHFIPNCYKVASREQRLELLAGLLDSDGYYDKSNTYTFTSVSKDLSEGVRFVARSLGLQATLFEKDATLNGKFISKAYNVCLSGDIDLIPVRLGYKKASPRKQIKDVLCTGLEIEALPEDDFYGFTLDSDHLYLTSDFIVHHNTGKSICLAEFMRLVCQWWPGQKLMLLTHVKELIAQNAAKLKELWPEAPLGIYSSGLKKKDVHDQIIYAGIASVAKKAHLFGSVSLILVDECHLISPKDQTMYQAFFAALRERNPYLKIIGFTATAFRMGFGPIVRQEGDEELGVSAMFDHIVFDGSSVEYFNWFISEGYLMPLIPKRTKMQLDVSGVGKRGGEYISSELQAAVNKAEANQLALNEALAVAGDRKKWLVFCAGVEHAEDFAALLNQNGVKACAVHSKMGGKERDQAIADFKSGKLMALTNNNVLTTGFDCPDIDLIIMLRPTGSPVLWVQMLGRGTRPVYAPGFDLADREQRLAAIAASDKQNCLVLDFSGNSRRLGPINDPAVPRRPGQKGGGAPIYKSCEVCGTDGQYPAWRFCGGVSAEDTAFKAGLGFCGAPFTFKEKLKRAASSEELVKNQMPVIEVFDVENVVYQKNVNRGDRSKPPTLKVTYYCGHKTFVEYVCLQHSDWAGRKAYKWWTIRSPLPLPASVDDALDVINQLAVPTQIRVHTNVKWPIVLACCYDGSRFGEREAQTTSVGVQIYTKNAILSNNVGEQQNLGPSYDDDEAYLPAHASAPMVNVVQSMNSSVQKDEEDFDDIPF